MPIYGGLQGPRPWSDRSAGGGHADGFGDCLAPAPLTATLFPGPCGKRPSVWGYARGRIEVGKGFVHDHRAAVPRKPIGNFHEAARRCASVSTGIETHYYTAEVHKAAFALPPYIAGLVG